MSKGPTSGKAYFSSIIAVRNRKIMFFHQFPFGAAAHIKTQILKVGVDLNKIDNRQISTSGATLAKGPTSGKAYFSSKIAVRYRKIEILHQFPLGAAALGGSDSRRPINPERGDVVFFQ